MLPLSIAVTDWLSINVDVVNVDDVTGFELAALSSWQKTGAMKAESIKATKIFFIWIDLD